MSDCLLLMAQAAIDPISGGAGWAGAGLLGLVLSWVLLIHLPAQRKESKDERDAFGKTIKDLSDTFKDALKTQSERFDQRSATQREDYASSLKVILTSSERQLERVLEALRSELRQLAASQRPDEIAERAIELIQHPERRKEKVRA